MSKNTRPSDNKTRMDRLFTPPLGTYLTAAVGSRNERHAPAFLSVGAASSRGPAGHTTVPLSVDCRRCIRSGCWNLLIWTSSLDSHRPGTWVEIMAGSYKAQAAAARPRHETRARRERRMECNLCNLGPKARASASAIGNQETRESGKQTKYGQTKHTFKSVLKTKKRDTLAFTSVDSPADPFRDLQNPSLTWPHQISTCITLRRPNPQYPPFGPPTRNYVRKITVGVSSTMSGEQNRQVTHHDTIRRALRRRLTD